VIKRKDSYLAGGQMKRGRPRSNTNRDKQIAAAVARGETFEAVGNRYGITRERVRQIAVGLGVQSQRAFPIIIAKARERRKARIAAKKEKRGALEAIADRLYRLVKSGKSILAAGRELGLTRSQTASISQRKKLGAVTQHGRWRIHRHR
jgi:hypothetical protein